MDLIITIVSTILIFGLIIFIHELGHFACAIWTGVRVNEFSLGMGPKLFSVTKKGIIYSIRAFPIGGFVSMEGEDENSDDKDAFCNKSIPKRVLVIVAGATMNIILGAVLIIGVTANQDLISTTIISSFTENASSNSMLQNEDEIVSVNGRNVETVNSIGMQLMRDSDGIVDIVVNRDGKEMELTQVPFDMVEIQEGISTIQLDFMVYGKEPTFTGIIKESFYWTTGIMEQVYVSFYDLITGKYGLNHLSGPIGVSEVIGEATSQGMDHTLLMTALLSINIGIFNLMPLPALDGGRLVFLFIEAVSKKKVPAKYEAWVNGIGLIALMGLMLVVTFNDILKLF